MILLIRFYQIFLRPLLTQLYMVGFGFQYHCVFKQSCSEYTIFQIRKHGTITGLKNGLQRFSRCCTAYAVDN